MKPVVLGFSGRIGSGKSTLAALIADSLQVPCVSFGDYIRGLASHIGLNAYDRTVLQDLGLVLAKHPTIFCANVLQQANYQPGQSLVIDGVRHQEIVEELRKQVAPASFALVYVKISEGRIEDELHSEGNRDQYISGLVKHDTELQVLTVLEGVADIVVDNSRVRPLEDVTNDVLRGLDMFSKNMSLSEHFIDDLAKWVRTTSPEGEIRFDKNGVAWLDSTATKAIEVIQDRTELGRSIDEMIAQHPHLSRTQVRAALRYYENNHAEVDEEIERRYQYTESIRQQATRQLSREELEKRLRDRKAGQPRD